MGIASSIQIPPEKPEQEKPDDFSDWPYPMTANAELLMKNLYGLFPPRAGESSTDEAAEARYMEFMRGGCCKDAFNALMDCEGPRSSKCKQTALMLFNCMYSHPDYYQPVNAVWETSFEKLEKDLEVFRAKKQRDESFEKANLFKCSKRF
ncbi:GCK domain-containing protein [Raphanus sativus]|uniref:Uncharacterized protein LOC108821243 n=1 Tax=Raphanus sativus TaxID=3726 RepID=A0A6J0KPB3_RAPSA|nr:uncharacterized protein LOC108821243 [Raphanus sativus]KAJ4879416.1 GCK domain-containing protein [Raphanus sativus]